MSLFELITVVVLGGSLNGLKERNQHTDNLTGPDFSAEASLVKCTLQGTPRQPAFSMDGDFVIGGTFLIHYQAQTVINNYTSKPELPICKGRLVKRKDEVC